MEVIVAKTMFQYFGDGDSKGHAEVKDVYEGVILKKQECVGHVQKRVGNQLRALKRKRKEVKMADSRRTEQQQKEEREGSSGSFNICYN